MSDIFWGKPIEVNGVRPSWLRDEEECKWGNSFECLGAVERANESAWDVINYIHLPASHPYYTVQRYNAEHGTSFVYWPGGDAAPADWDEGDALDARPGIVLPYEDSPNWRSITIGSPYNGSLNIIGYTRRTEPRPATDDSDYVRVKRLTHEEIYAALPRWADVEGQECALKLAKHLGIIKPEPSEAERIAAKTGITVEQVQAVLDAQNA